MTVKTKIGKLSGMAYRTGGRIERTGEEREYDLKVRVRGMEEKRLRKLMYRLGFDIVELKSY